MPLSLKERRRRELVRQRRRRRLLIGIPLIVVLVVFGTLIYTRFLRNIPGVQESTGQARNHNVEANLGAGGLPPMGGSHRPQWLNCGVYEEAVSTELAVHSMEHGALWLAYRPDLPEDEVSTLERYGDNFTVVAPYPDLESPIVATAWGVQLQLDEASDERLEQFIARYKGRGPEQGATCSGGAGVPLS